MLRFGHGRDLHPVGLGPPPARIPACRIPHWALASGSDVKSLYRPRVQYSRTWEPPIHDGVHPLPVRIVSLAPAPKRSDPLTSDLSSESAECTDVGRHGVVCEVTSHHHAKPPAVFGHGLMLPPLHGRFERLQRGPHPGFHRMPSQ